MTAIIIDKRTNQVLDIKCERLVAYDGWFALYFQVLQPRYFYNMWYRLAGTTY